MIRQAWPRTLDVFLLVSLTGCVVAEHSEKAGKCHKASSSLAEFCTYECTYDEDCRGDYKCCSTGCGLVCQSPIYNEAISKGAECPQVSYRTDSFGYTWPMTSFIYCSTGCCGSRNDQYCCDEKSHMIGMLVGIVATSLVVVVITISVTCCCIHKYNKKNVMVGINPGTIYRPQASISPHVEIPLPTAPPLYEQTTGTESPAGNPYVYFPRSSAKVFHLS